MFGGFLYSGMGWKIEGWQASVAELYWGRDRTLLGCPIAAPEWRFLGAYLRRSRLFLAW